jgi:hypothetical protein
LNEPVSKEQFELYLTKAVSISVDAISTFELFYCLINQRQKKTYRKVFEKHAKVFSFIKFALFNMLVLSLHKPLEDSKEPVSLYRCVSIARQLMLINQDQQKSLKRRINAMTELVPEIRTSG